MSSISSPHHEVTDLMRRRNLTNISIDQQSLLEAPGSWAVDLDQQHHGAAQVPSHVLESVKAAYVAQLEANKKPKASKKSSNSENSISSTPKLNGHSERLAVQSQIPPSSLQKSSPENSPERSISWSPSPVREEPNHRQADVESPIVRETPRAAPNSVLKKTPKSLPMAPPPRPSSVLRPNVDIEYPSSGPEEDLEMELPQAQARLDAPINRIALRLQATVPSPISSGRKEMDTPPCAQVTQLTQPAIPSTVVQEPTAQSDAAPKNGHKRRMKEIDFGDEPPKRARSTMNRLAPTKDYSQLVSSNSTSSSSVVPATHPTQISVINSIEDHRSVCGGETFSKEYDMQMQIHQPQEPSSALQTYPGVQSTVHEHPISLAKQLMAAQDPPYEVFCKIYPEHDVRYPGSEYEFVWTCLLLEQARSARALRECLFDDFIRLGSEYRRHVNTARPHADVAMEWFNSTKGPPVFDRMVVTSENLGYILDHYQNIVVKVKNTTSFTTHLDDVQHAGALPHPTSAMVETLPPSEATTAPRSTLAPASGRPRSVSKGSGTPVLKKPSESPSTPAPTTHARALAPLVQAPVVPTSSSKRRGSSIPSHASTGRPISSKATPASTGRLIRGKTPSTSGRPFTARAPSSSIGRPIGSKAPPSVVGSVAGSMAPPPSKGRSSSMAPTSSMIARNTPRRSQYLERLDSRKGDKTASRRRSMEQRAQLQEYFKKTPVTQRRASTAL